MMQRIQLAAVVVVLAAVLGATVFSEQVAWAAQEVGATIVGPLDQAGNVKVAESGSTVLIAAGRVGYGSQLGPVDVSAFKQVRFSVGGRLCTGLTRLIVYAKEPSAPTGSGNYPLEFVDLCDAVSWTYEVPGRTLELTCRCDQDHYAEIAIWGRRN